jgi:bacteriocin-like protein
MHTNVVAPRITWIGGFHARTAKEIDSPRSGLPEHRTGARRYSGIPKGEGGFMKDKKLTLSKETLRTLDEKELSQIVGGEQSGGNVPPAGGPNTCPNTKGPGNSCT